MKKLILKIQAVILVTTLTTTFFIPQQAKAQLATIDAGNLVQNTLTAINSTATSISTYYMEYKESILDPLFWAAAKALIQNMTADIVDWINSGFEGNPAFLDNPSGFFLDSADQVTGVFLSNGGLLSALCSPFSVDIRLSLALNMGSRDRERYVCTLSTVMNSIANSSVNVNSQVDINSGYGSPRTRGTSGSIDFNNAALANFTTNGDFYQGGWPAYMALTTEPQNNAIGAYLQSQSDLISEIVNNQNRITLDLQLGSGFLSSTKCTDVPVYGAGGGYNEAAGAGGGFDQNTADSLVSQGQLTKKLNPDGTIKYQQCKTTTPGSVIGESLNKHLGAGVDQLNLADEINEIIGALFAQLAKTVLTKGLSAASGNSDNSLETVTQQLRKEVGKEFAPQRQKLIDAVNRYLQPTGTFGSFRDQSLAVILAEKSKFDSALACFNTEVAKVPPPLNVSQIEGYIDEITNFITTQINPEISRLENRVEGADSKYEKLLKIRSDAQNAKNMIELQAPAQAYASMISNRELVDTQDVATAQQGLANAKNIAASWEDEAERFQELCEDISTP